MKFKPGQRVGTSIEKFKPNDRVKYDHLGKMHYATVIRCTEPEIFLVYSDSGMQTEMHQDWLYDLVEPSELLKKLL